MACKGSLQHGVRVRYNMACAVCYSFIHCTFKHDRRAEELGEARRFVAVERDADYATSHWRGGSC